MKDPKAAFVEILSTWRNSVLAFRFNVWVMRATARTRTRRTGMANRMSRRAHALRALLPAAILVGLALLCGLAYADVARSPLDPSFGRKGVVVTPSPGESWEGVVSGITEDRHGRLIAAGSTAWGSFALMRYRADGSLDTSLRDSELEKGPFYTGGYVGTEVGGEDGARDVAVQSNGDIVAVGYNTSGGSFSAFALARYRESGSLDTSFGRNGRVLTPLGENGGGAFAVAIQPDGKILAAGFRETRQRRTEGLLIRYMPNGAIDRGFGSHGEVRFATPHRGQAKLHDIAVLPSGKILVAGGFHDEFMLARLLPDGRPDRSFGGRDGRVLTDVNGSAYCPSNPCAHATSLALSHGRILLAGNAADARSAQFVAVTRYRANGRLDRSFGDKGLVRFRRATI